MEPLGYLLPPASFCGRAPGSRDAEGGRGRASPRCCATTRSASTSSPLTSPTARPRRAARVPRRARPGGGPGGGLCDRRVRRAQGRPGRRRRHRAGGPGPRRGRLQCDGQGARGAASRSARRGETIGMMRGGAWSRSDWLLRSEPGITQGIRVARFFVCLMTF